MLDLLLDNEQQSEHALDKNGMTSTATNHLQAAEAADVDEGKEVPPTPIEKVEQGTQVNCCQSYKSLLGERKKTNVLVSDLVSDRRNRGQASRLNLLKIEENADDEGLEFESQNEEATRTGEPAADDLEGADLAQKLNIDDQMGTEASSGQTLKEMYLLEEIEDFINRMQLSTDEMILRYIYPTFFRQRMKEKFLAQHHQHQDQDDAGERDGLSDGPDAALLSAQFDEAFASFLPSKQSDPKQINYIPIRKDALLQDIKQFLYNYCTSGQIYPNYHKSQVVHAREEVIVNENIAKQDPFGNSAQAKKPNANHLFSPDELELLNGFDK